MTKKPLLNDSQIQEEKPSKKEKIVIRKSDGQRELEKEMLRRYLKNLWIYSPFFLSLMTIKISFILAMFIAGFTGVFVVVRKEALSGRGTIRGTAAIAIGIILIIIPWGLAALHFFLN